MGYIVQSHTITCQQRTKVVYPGIPYPLQEINPNQASIVASVFDDVLHGMGLSEITKELNRKGINGPRGKGWAKTGLYSILTNEIYTGTLVWGHYSKRGLQPIRVESACPAIVDEDTFIKVQSQMKERAPVRLHPKRAASRFLLSGLARCGHCGKALVGQDAKGGQFSYYVCGTLNKKGAGSCPAHYLNSAKFEGLVVDKVKEHILTPDNLTRLVELVNEEMDRNSKAYQDELDSIVDEVADINHRLDRLYDAIETGGIDLNDLAPRIRELRKRQEKLRIRKAEIDNLLSERRVGLASPKVVAEYVSDLRNLLNESSLPERRAFIRSFIKEVKVAGNEVLLTYTMPLPPTGISKEKVGVLSTVQYSGR